MPLHNKLPADLKEVDVIVSFSAALKTRLWLTDARLREVLAVDTPPHALPLNIFTGGLAGCVVASRLAEADRNLTILVIEQGPNNYGMPEVVHPALYPRNLFPNSKITLFWQTKKSPQLADRSPIVPSGGTLGGGSAMNWMAGNVRPPPSHDC